MIIAIALALTAGSGTVMAAGVDTALVSAVALTSDYVHRGLSQSSERPALQLSAGLRRSDGYYGHLWLSTLDTRRQAPDFGDRGAQADVVIGLTRPLSDAWTFDLGLGRYETFATDQILDYDYTEVSVALAYRDRLRLLYAYSPKATDHTREDAKLSGPRHVAEIAYEWPLTRWLSIGSGVGYADLERVSEVRYRFAGVGATVRHGRYLATVNVFTTDGAARERFVDGRADTRLVLTLIARVWGGG